MLNIHKNARETDLENVLIVLNTMLSLRMPMQEYFIIILLMDLTVSGRNMNNSSQFQERNMLNTIWKTSWISRDVFNLPSIEFLFVLLRFNFSNTWKKNYLQGKIFPSFNKIHKSLEVIIFFTVCCIKLYPQKNLYENIYLPAWFL